MSDKQNDNKLMAMLERRGIVRKTDSDDIEAEAGADDAQARPDLDLRAMFGTSPGDAPKVTPAARQPVPGLSNPVFPSDRPAQADREQAQPEQPRSYEPPRGDPVQARAAAAQYAEALYAEPQSSAQQQPGVTLNDEPPRYEPLQTFQPIQPPVVQQPAPNQAPPPAPVSNAYEAYEPQQLQAGDTTGVFLEIEELYAALSLRSKRTDSIYLVEEYLRSLPESLPLASRRDIVSRIVAASGFDYDLLQGDGIMRVKLLKEYAERFARFTDDYVAMRQAELEALEQQMYEIRVLIDNRRDLHKRQFFAIEAEAQRLKDILTFISG